MSSNNLAFLKGATHAVRRTRRLKPLAYYKRETAEKEEEKVAADNVTYGYLDTEKEL